MLLAFSWPKTDAPRRLQRREAPRRCHRQRRQSQTALGRQFWRLLKPTHPAAATGGVFVLLPSDLHKFGASKIRNDSGSRAIFFGWKWEVSLWLDPKSLQEAFESGRTVALRLPEREQPITGCVSFIHEGAAAGDYVFSAFVGRERVVISNDDARVEATGRTN